MKQLKLTPEFIRLTSIDGIGLILALTIMLETGDINRLDQVGNYASYCRCVSGARYSNGKKKSSTNTKNGNKYLAWAFIEAANFAIRYNDTVKRYYQKKLAKKKWSLPERQLHINSRELVFTYCAIKFILMSISHLDIQNVEKISRVRVK